MKKYISNNLLLFTTVILLISCNKLDFTGKNDLRNTTDSLSYFVGIYTGWTLKEAGFEDLNKTIFDTALHKVFNTADTSRLEYLHADKVIAQYIQKGRNTRTLAEGREFLEKNKTQKGITITPSGLQYLRLREGKGIRPHLGDSVVALFTGYTHDGQVFMNINSPYKMLLKDGTKGGLEAFQLMEEGSKYKFFLPTELAYGLNPLPGGILKTNMAVIYDIELISVIPVKR